MKNQHNLNLCLTSTIKSTPAMRNQILGKSFYQPVLTIKKTKSLSTLCILASICFARSGLNNTTSIILIVLEII